MIGLARSMKKWNEAAPPGWKQAVLGSGAIVVCVLIFAALFREETLGAFRVWVVSPTFHHCFIVLPMSLFLVWLRRDALVGAAPEPDPRAALPVLLLSVMWFVASEAGVLEAQQFIVVTMIQATLWAALGASIYRKLAAPFLYLYFLVPSGAYLVPVLQSFTARFAVTGLHLFGIPVFSNGAVIEIPAGTFTVAEACAGLRFLIAAVAFGVFFAIITYRSWWRRTVFIALSIIVPVLANGLRALGLIATAQWIGSPSAALADHLIYGWIFFSIILVMLVLLGNTFSDRAEADGRAAVSALVAGEVWRGRWKAIGTSAALCVFAASFVPVAAAVFPDPPHPALPVQAPAVVSSWQGTNSDPGWRPVIAPANRSFLQSFTRGEDRVDRFVAIYGAQGRSDRPVHMNNRDANEPAWSFDYSKLEYLHTGNLAVPVQESVWVRGGEKRIVWSFYVIGRHAVAEVWAAKWAQLLADVTRSRCLAAYVALSVQMADITSARRLAGELLAGSEDMDSYLCRPTKGPERR